MAPIMLRNAALKYAARGWHVIPLHHPASNGTCSCGDPKCRSVGKHPRTPHGALDGTTNPEQIRAWWKRWPEANIGLCTGPLSRLYVVDIDPRHDGDATWNALEREHGELETVEALTGGGGRHLLFWWPTTEENLPIDLQAKAGLLGVGVDTKGEGGFIVAAPSLHESGRRYEWEVEHHPGDHDPSDLPEWLLERVLDREAPKKRTGKAGKTRRGKRIRKTDRDRMMRLLSTLGVEFEERDGEQRVRCPDPAHKDQDPSCDLDLARGVWICRSCGAGGGVRELEKLAGPLPRPPTAEETLGDDPEERGLACKALTAAGIAHDPAEFADQTIVCPTCGGHARLKLGAGVKWCCKTSHCHSSVRGNCGGLLVACGVASKTEAFELSPQEKKTLHIEPCRAAPVVFFGHRHVSARKVFLPVGCNACPACRARAVITRYRERARARIADAYWSGVAEVPLGRWAAFRQSIPRALGNPAILRLATTKGRYRAIVVAESVREDTRQTADPTIRIVLRKRVVAQSTVQEKSKKGAPASAGAITRSRVVLPIDLVELPAEPVARLEAVAELVADCARYAGSPARRPRERVLALPRAWGAQARAKGEWAPEGEGVAGAAPEAAATSLAAACRQREIPIYPQGTRGLLVDTAHPAWPDARRAGGVYPGRRPRAARLSEGASA